MGLGNDSRLRRYDDIRDMIGDVAAPTPLVALPRLVPGPALTLYAKLEWMNPFGSVKDRAAKWMLEAMAAEGMLEGRTIVEATSGNTGIAVAAMAALMGVPMAATVPWNIPVEKDVLLRMLGADVIRSPQSDPAERHPMDAAIEMAEELVTSGRGYVKPDQYANPDNVRAHYESTGPEIWEQTDGRVRYFFAGIGTTGTLSGVGRFLKEQDPSIRIVAVEPVRGHHISGLKNLEETAVPEIVDRSVLDEIVYVDDAAARAMTLRAYREEALMVGASGGAILAGALPYLAGREGVGVALMPDTGQKAISFLAEVLREEEA